MAVRQLPAKIDVEFVAGDPFPITFTATSGVTTFASPVVTMKTATGDAYTTDPGIPTVGAASAVLTCTWSDADTAALNTTTRGVVYKYSVEATADGAGPFQIFGGTVKVWPVGTTGVSVSSASAALTLGGVNVTATVSLGGGSMTGAAILSALLTIDGAGSGLDADTLDGSSSSSFATAAHDHSGTYQPLATVLTNTTASFLTADETKLDGIEAGAQVNTVTATNTVTLTNKTLNSHTNSIDANNLHIQVYNNTGSTIAIGTPVYISAVNVGEALPEVTPADASALGTMPALGLTEAAIPTGTSGSVIRLGRVSGVNTAAYTIGDKLYVSETAGVLTTTRPSAPAISQQIATVLYAHASLGVFDVASNVALIPASETAVGGVELATRAEAAARADTERAVTPDGLDAAFDAHEAAADPHPGYVTTAEAAESMNTVAASGATLSIAATTDIHDITVTANCAITITGAVTVRSILMRFSGDGTARTVTLPGGGTVDIGAVDADLAITGITKDAGVTWDFYRAGVPSLADASSSATNLAYTAAAGNGIVTSDTGTDATLTAADGTNAGLLLPAGYTKLAGIEASADVTDTANVTAAGALMDSEVDADIKTLVLPASTTISAFGATLVDDADNTAARTTLGLGTAATTAAADYATAAQGTTADAALPKVAAGASVENVGAVESNVNTVATSGATETLDTAVYGVHDVTMDQACTFTFSNPAPSGKATMFTLILRGAFTPTWPAAVDWPDATQPTYATPTVYTFLTVDAGTTWLGAAAGKAFG